MQVRLRAYLLEEAGIQIQNNKQECSQRTGVGQAIYKQHKRG